MTPTTTYSRLSQIEVTVDFLRDRIAEYDYRLRTDPLLRVKERQAVEDDLYRASIKVIDLLAEADALKANGGA